jgi:hypothetical protein
VGRKLNVVSLIGTLSILAAGSVLAQHPGPRRGGFFHRHNGQFKNNAQFKSQARERLLQLSPEDRQTFKKNAERWLQMSPEERTLLRNRAIMRRERIKSEAETVLRDSGLQLDPAKRNLFQERYLQERRRIDRELRQEYENKRQQQLERLKKEFQPPPNSSSSTSTPAITITPNRSATEAAKNK